MSDEMMVLNEKAAELGRKFEGINNWIKNNPSTYPSFSEMIRCIAEFGNLNTMFADTYKKQKIDVTVQNETEEHVIPLTFLEMKNVRNNLEEMINLRADSDLFKDLTAREFMLQLLDAAGKADYDSLDDQHRGFKEEFLSRVAGVYYYIWETKQRNPDYVYDNMGELQALKDSFQQYRDYGLKDGVLQFDEITANMLDNIESNKIMNVCVAENQDILGTELFDLKLQAYMMKYRFNDVNIWIE